MSKECLQYSVANEIKDGIWGGKNEADRNALIREHIRDRRRQFRLRKRRHKLQLTEERMRRNDDEQRASLTDNATDVDTNADTDTDTDTNANGQKC